MSNVLGEIPVLHFHSEFNICPECGTVLSTQKVKQRTVFTISYSEIVVKEHIKENWSKMKDLKYKNYRQQQSPGEKGIVHQTDN